MAARAAAADPLSLSLTGVGDLGRRCRPGSCTITLSNRTPSRPRSCRASQGRARPPWTRVDAARQRCCCRGFLVSRSAAFAGNAAWRFAGTGHPPTPPLSCSLYQDLVEAGRQNGVSWPPSRRAYLDVQSRHLVDRVEPEACGLACPSFADGLVGREPFQGLQTPCEAAGPHPRGEPGQALRLLIFFRRHRQPPRHSSARHRSWSVIRPDLLCGHRALDRGSGSRTNRSRSWHPSRTRPRMPSTTPARRYRRFAESATSIQAA
jgi:hypothetical protein